VRHSPNELTHRAFALQRSSGTIAFDGPISTTLEPLHHMSDPPLAPVAEQGHSLRYLALLFSYVDRSLLSCWSERCSTPCTTLTRRRLILILTRLSAPPSEIFGDHAGRKIGALTDSQKADLLITWQWLRNRMWRTHGLTEEGGERVLSVDFVLDVAKTTVRICQDLSFPAMEAHGTGFVSRPGSYRR
jgi:hypothetical protein